MARQVIRDGGSADTKEKKSQTKVTTGTLPNGSKFSYADIQPTPAMPGMSKEAITEWIRTGKNTAGNKVQLTNEQVAQIVNSVVATTPASTNKPMSAYFPTTTPAPVTTSGGGGGGGGGKPKPVQASAIQNLYDKLIAEAEARQFDTGQFDVKQKYLAEQIAAAKAAQTAAESQANLQYQALAQMAAQQQAEALAGTGAGYTEALGQMAEQGGAAAAIGGGTGAALEQQFAAQRIADEQAIRELGAATGGAVSSASALQQLLNQAAMRDFGVAQSGAEAAIAAEQARALAAFEAQRSSELADYRMKRAVEIERQREEARKAAAAAAAARAKAAQNAAAAAAATANIPNINIGATGIGSKLNTAFGSQQVAKDRDTGNPILDQNKKPVMEGWGTYVTRKNVDGKATIISVPTGTIAGDVTNLALLVNNIMTDTVGQYKGLTPTQRENTAATLIINTKKQLGADYGGVTAVNEAWKAPVSEGGLGLPSSTSEFIKLTSTVRP